MDFKTFKRKAKTAILNPSSIVKYATKNTKMAWRGHYYSQNAEDVLILEILRHFGRPISFIEIGSNHPYRFSNTMLIEEKLKIQKGVLVEPNPDLGKLLKKKRQNDKIINKGVGICNDTLTYYLMSSDTLNTFSKTDAEMSEKDGYPIIDEIQVEVVDINELLQSEFPNGDLDYISVDIEGEDFEVVRAIDYNRFKPKVICIETAARTGNIGKRKDLVELVKFLKSNDYAIYADTLINTIFVQKSACWKTVAEDLYDVIMGDCQSKPQ